MRAGAVTAALAVAIALGAYFGLHHSRRSEALARTAAASPPPLVTCDAIALRPRSLSPRDRIVLGRVAFVGARVYQTAAVGGDGPLRLWAKVGLYVRAGSRPMTLALPDAWRRRARVTWGTGIVPALRISACPLPPGVWNGYAGGFYVRERACVPLRVRIGRRSAVLRFGIGRPCADR